MAKLVLAGGTDVAEMALFSIDALPNDRPPDEQSLKCMEEQGVLIRFSTGADGDYLLHAYLNEDIPAEVRRHCVVGNAKAGRLRLASGRIGFGGSESLVSTFAPNQAIRADSTVPPGDYEVTAFHTEYPDELIETAVEARLGVGGNKLLNLPGKVIGIAALLTVIAFSMKAVFVAMVIVAATFVGLRYLFFKNPKIQALEREKRSIESSYPSIVVEMRSTPAQL